MANLESDNFCYASANGCISPDGYCNGNLCARLLFDDVAADLTRYDEVPFSSGYVDGMPTGYRDFGHRISPGINSSGRDN
jgi:hypothetical protein